MESFLRFEVLGVLKTVRIGVVLRLFFGGFCGFVFVSKFEVVDVEGVVLFAPVISGVSSFFG